MSKKANPVKIGIFILGALAMISVAIVVFGSSRLFKRSSEYVMFFDSSISGLSEGAKVILRGVPVGRVTKIRLDTKQGDEDFVIPVFIEIYPDKFNMNSYNLSNSQFEKV